MKTDAMPIASLCHLHLQDPRLSELCAGFEVWADRAERAGLRFYLALDAVWAEDLATYVRATCADWQPLEGELGVARTEAHPRAPILVDITAHKEVIRPWIEQYFLARIGVVFASRLPIEKLRTSLKRFGLVVCEGGRDTVVFRYFDAEVFDAFLHVSYPMQRRDFFEGIEGVVLPHISGDAWAVFFLSEQDELLTGCGHPDQIAWEPLPVTIEGPTEQSAYSVGFPFRTLLAVQMAEMERATRRAFHREAARFIAMAFPDDGSTGPMSDLVELSEAAHRVAEENGATEESAAFLWIVLSFMSGMEFHKTEAVGTLLQMPGKDLESKLEDLVFDIGLRLQNDHLMELCDTVEVWAESADGVRRGERHRSGLALGAE